MGYDLSDAPSLAGKLVAKTKQHPVTEIRLRALVYDYNFPEAALTLAAFNKHWAWLGSANAQKTVEDKHAQTEQLERAARLRRIEQQNPLHSNQLGEPQ